MGWLRKSKMDRCSKKYETMSYYNKKYSMYKNEYQRRKNEKELCEARAIY